MIRLLVSTVGAHVDALGRQRDLPVAHARFPKLSLFASIAALLPRIHTQRSESRQGLSWNWRHRGTTLFKKEGKVIEGGKLDAFWNDLRTQPRT